MTKEYISLQTSQAPNDSKFTWVVYKVAPKNGFGGYKYFMLDVYRDKGGQDTQESGSWTVTLPKDWKSSYFVGHEDKKPRADMGDTMTKDINEINKFLMARELLK